MLYVSHIFTLIKAEKTQKNFSTPFSKNFYKFSSPIGQKFQNLKNFFRQLFLIKNMLHVSHIFTLIKAKKHKKIFRPPFSKIFTSSDLL